MTFRVSEIFYSIQGESSFAGYPTTFARFYGCNMRCTWCDTKYAIEGGDFFEMSLEILSERLLKRPTPHICLTGGEPTIQRELPELVDFLIMAGKIVSIETDGGVPLDKFVDMDCHLIMDIKLPGSGMHSGMVWDNLDLLRGEIDEIKFVILNEEDYKWARNWVLNGKSDHQNLKYVPVLFSAVIPEGSMWEKQLTNVEGLPNAVLAEWILRDKLPVRFQTQMHKVIWPEKTRGF